MSTGQRLAASLLIGAVRVARTLPDGLVYRAAWLVGQGLYLVLPGRRTLVRANLRRVCGWLAEHGGGSPASRRAATDPRRLEAMVRAAFGHWAVTYAESAMAPRYDARALRRRVVPADPGLVATALAPAAHGDPGRIFVSLHFGSVEMAGLYASRLGGVPVTAPMETLARPVLRAYFEDVRKALGLRVVPARGAAAELAAALARGEAVGLVADRNVSGTGQRVDLFGAPARLPVGAAVLAAASGAPVYVLAVRRTAPGAWLGVVERVKPPPDTARREAARSVLEGQARAFERLVADAPEQWWALFQRVWDDLPTGRTKA